MVENWRKSNCRSGLAGSLKWPGSTYVFGMSIDPLTWVAVTILVAMVLVCCSHPPPDVYTGPGCDGP
jgi:hypothetical protein